MTQEKPNQVIYEYTKLFRNNESILINGGIGITVTIKHNQIHLAIIDEEIMVQKTNHLESWAAFSPFIVRKLKITTNQEINNQTELKIESKEPIQIGSYNYPQDFLKLFEYRIERKKELGKLSRNIAKIEYCLSLTEINPSLEDNPQHQ